MPLTLSDADADQLVEWLSEIGDLSYQLGPDPNPVGIGQRLRVISSKHILHADPPPPPPPPPAVAIMLDAAVAANIPTDAGLIAGYVDGALYTWAGRPEVPSGDWARFPNAKRLTITATGANAATFGDCEEGDMDPAMAATWLANYPGNAIYASLAKVPVIKAACAAVGIGSFRMWIAHYTGQAHICGAICVASLPWLPANTLDGIEVVGTQYADPGPYDKSLMTAAFLATV